MSPTGKRGKSMYKNDGMMNAKNKFLLAIDILPINPTKTTKQRKGRKRVNKKNLVLLDSKPRLNLTFTWQLITTL